MPTKALIKIKEKWNEEKIEKWINKIIFVIEFVISIIMMYSIYKIVLFKNYVDIWNLKYIIIGTFATIIVMFTIIWNCKHNKNVIEKIIITFLIPIGMMYVFFISPSYVPDEHAHIWKAIDISQGNIITKIEEDGSSKTLVPKFFDKYRIPNIKSYGEFNSVINEETDYTDLVEVENPAQAYPAILYFTSAIGFFIGRILLSFHLC